MRTLLLFTYIAISLSPFDRSPEHFAEAMQPIVGSFKSNIDWRGCHDERRLRLCDAVLDNVSILVRGSHSPARTTEITLIHYRNEVQAMARPLAMIMVGYDPGFITGEGLQQIEALIEAMQGNRPFRVVGKEATYFAVTAFNKDLKVDVATVTIEPRQ